MSAKNLGQIAGLHIGSTPPNNTTLIWFDDTPAIRRHKVYDFATSQWIVLERSIITSITYSELTNKAQGTGLSVGEYFMITDKANALALAITRTKVQYTDIQGNILIDDLGTNIVYHVNSSNLLIDDINGVYDEETSTLVFRFTEIDTPEQDDYILAKGQRKSGGSSVWQFLKFKISNFISKKTGNSLKWDDGLFLDVIEQIKDTEDTPNGVVSMQTFTEKVNALETSINNVGKENQSIIDTTNQNINSATTPTAIYSKKLPTAPTAATATDIVKGDTLTTIVNKIQRWITQFKIATGIKVSKDFAANGSDFNINNNDTVDSALRKVQGNMQNYRKGLSDFKTEWGEYKNGIDEDLENYKNGIDTKIQTIQTQVNSANARQGDTILVSKGTGSTPITPTEVTKTQHNITFGETLKSAFQKLLYMCTKIQNWQIVNKGIGNSCLYTVQVINNMKAPNGVVPPLTECMVMLCDTGYTWEYASKDMGGGKGLITTSVFPSDNFQIYFLNDLKMYYNGHISGYNPKSFSSFEKGVQPCAVASDSEKLDFVLALAVSENNNGQTVNYTSSARINVKLEISPLTNNPGNIESIAVSKTVTTTWNSLRKNEWGILNFVEFMTKADFVNSNTSYMGAGTRIVITLENA